MIVLRAQSFPHAACPERLQGSNPCWLLPCDWVSQNFDEMLAADLHQLLQLLCPDFPVDLVMQAARRLHPEQSAREAAAVPLRVAQMLQQVNA